MDKPSLKALRKKSERLRDDDWADVIDALPALLAIVEAARERAAAEFDAMVAHAAGDIPLRTQHGKRYAEADTRLTAALALVEE